MEATVIIAFVHLVTKESLKWRKTEGFLGSYYSFKELKKMNSYPSNHSQPKTSAIVPNMKERLASFTLEVSSLENRQSMFLSQIIRPVLGLTSWSLTAGRMIIL